METILIVDDIEVNRKLLAQCLGMFKDYKLIEATNGQEAIEQYTEQQPDLILMDIDMPIMDGREATSRIKTKMQDDYIPVIFVTALNSESMLADALADGGDDYISKPFDMKTLESKINAHLRIRELNKKLCKKNAQLSNQQDIIENFFHNASQYNYLDNRYIKHYTSSLNAFNGDILLAARGPHGGITIILGDFTGHGLTAAMGTLPVAMTFFEMARKGAAIEDMAYKLNTQLHALMPTGMFLCATFININVVGNTVSIWMGGMPEAYWFDNQHQLKACIPADHLALGILDAKNFSSTAHVFQVEQFDKFYFHTDGITEACRLDEERYGTKRLKNCLVNGGNTRFETVLSDLDKFTAASEQNDDISFLELTCDKSPTT